MKKHTAAVVFAGLLSATSVTADDDWGYSTNNGPSTWGNLNPAYAACSTGIMQSPINIEGTDPAVMHRLKTNYTVSPLDLKNGNHTVTMKYEPGSMLEVGQKSFMLKDFIFHTPSEHTVAGKRYPMEIQFRHESITGAQAIVSVLVTEGQMNKAASEIWQYLPIEKGQSSKPGKIYSNARDLMPNDASYYRYMGSLTTPPCNEGVNWYVMKSPVEFSAEQIAVMRSIIGGDTSRPVQSRNNRIILDANPE